MHYLGNMWFLKIFGSKVEDGMGHKRFLIFYLIAGMFGQCVLYLLQSSVLDARNRGVGSNCWGHGRLLCYVSEGKDSDIHSDIHFPVVYRDFRGLFPGVVVFVAVIFWYGRLLPVMVGEWHGGGILAQFIAGIILVPFFKTSRRYY